MLGVFKIYTNDDLFLSSCGPYEGTTAGNCWKAVLFNICLIHSERKTMQVEVYRSWWRQVGRLLKVCFSKTPLIHRRILEPERTLSNLLPTFFLEGNLGPKRGRDLSRSPSRIETHHFFSSCFGLFIWKTVVWSNFSFFMTPLIKSSTFQRKGKNQEAGSGFLSLVAFIKKFLPGPNRTWSLVAGTRPERK
jgi:hypothetical protein